MLNCQDRKVALLELMLATPGVKEASMNVASNLKLALLIPSMMVSIRAAPMREDAMETVFAVWTVTIQAGEYLSRPQTHKDAMHMPLETLRVIPQMMTGYLVQRRQHNHSFFNFIIASAKSPFASSIAFFASTSDAPVCSITVCTSSSEIMGFVSALSSEISPVI